MTRWLVTPVLVLLNFQLFVYGADGAPPKARLKLMHCGAIYRDDFNSGSPGRTPWRIWPAPKADAAFVRFEEGELRASGGGIVWARTADGDCAVAADVGHLAGTAPYLYQQVHLCAGSGGSADYSVQAYLTTDGKRTFCFSEYHTEVGTEGITRGDRRDPRNPTDAARSPSHARLRTGPVERHGETQPRPIWRWRGRSARWRPHVARKRPGGWTPRQSSPTGSCAAGHPSSP